jgi:uncharacterized protein (TIGR03435 family)
MVKEPVATLVGGILCAITLALAGVAGQEQATYALVLANSNGTLGPNLHPSAVGCATLRATATAPAGRENPPCNLRRDIGRVSASGMPVEQLSGMIADHSGFRVVDRTGLSGLYDWTSNGRRRTSVVTHQNASRKSTRTAPPYSTRWKCSLG